MRPPRVRTQRGFLPVSDGLRSVSCYPCETVSSPFHASIAATLFGLKASRDTHFVEKVEDVVGLYLNPPNKALVLSVDEKSQIQALDRLTALNRVCRSRREGPAQ